MTDRIAGFGSIRDFSPDDLRRDGVVVDGFPIWRDRRMVDLEGELTSVRAQLLRSRQEEAEQRTRCTQQGEFATALAHRLRSALALVQAMVNQTLREPVSADSARESLTARIAALGQAHALLIEERHTGADVARIVEMALAPHADGEARRVRSNGPEIRLEPARALALSMALHELGANAVTYGALSVEHGCVDIAWHLSCEEGRRRFTLHWCERDGPIVIPPRRRGFGFRLIERGLADVFGGEVELRPEPTGMVCRMSAVL